jgi:hypothetical protein
VAVHGAGDPLEVDNFDVLVNPTLKNAQAVISALIAMRITPNFCHTDLAKSDTQVLLKIMQYWADILAPAAKVSFSELLSRAVSAQIQYLTVHVIGRSDLIAMKRLASQRDTRSAAKHAADLQKFKTGIAGSNSGS